MIRFRRRGKNNMKGKLIGSLTTIIILVLLCSGILTDLARFFCWLFALQYAAPETSIAGGIVVRVLTFLVSYGLVGVIFNLLGWFNSKAMSVVYFVISTLLGFAIAYVVWIIETYILIIGIVLGIILAVVIAYIVIRVILNKKKEAKNE